MSPKTSKNIVPKHTYCGFSSAYVSKKAALQALFIFIHKEQIVSCLYYHKTKQYQVISAQHPVVELCVGLHCNSHSSEVLPA